MGKRFTIRRPLIPAMLGGVSACGVVVVVVFTPSREPLLALLVTVLVLSLLWLAHRLQGARYLHVREQFLGELCMVCGYDVRGGTSRCPECAARVWRASDPLEWPELLWPQMPANVIVSVGPHEFIEWMLAQRAGTAADVWHDVARQKAAFIVLNACGGFDDLNRFRPYDPFDIVSSRTFPISFIMHLHAATGVRLKGEDLRRFENLTLGEVVDAITERASRETSS